MRLHHIGYVGARLAQMERRFLQEGCEALSGAIADPTQQVVVQFFREPQSREVWELVAPLVGDGAPLAEAALVESPLQSRLRRGGGMDHVCYELEESDGSLEHALTIERQRGAHIICQPVLAAAFGRRIAFVFRRTGRVVELVEPRPPGALL